MNRRTFLSAAVAFAAGIPFVAASEQIGSRITVENPPEPGFEYMGVRRFRVFCNGTMLEACVRASVPDGKAWTHKRERQGKGGGPIVTTEIEHRGQIRLERIR